MALSRVAVILTKFKRNEGTELSRRARQELVGGGGSAWLFCDNLACGYEAGSSVDSSSQAVHVPHQCLTRVMRLMFLLAGGDRSSGMYTPLDARRNAIVDGAFRVGRLRVFAGARLANAVGLVPGRVRGERVPRPFF